jgi:hypothetical protein
MNERDRRIWRIAGGVCALLAASNLVAGIAGGLARLGWNAARGAPLAWHGLLLVCGFFGSVVALERAAALRQPLGLIVPLLAALGGVLAWCGAPIEIALVMWLVASGGLVLLCAWAAVKRGHALPLTIEMLGAACWLAGVLLWLQGKLAHEAMNAWMGFLVLTVAGERRERMPPENLSPVARGLFKAAVLSLAASVLLAVLDGVAALPGLGGIEASILAWWLGCLLLALWLLRFDLALRQWSAPGWQGASAQAFTLGYGWLLVAALLGLAGRWWPMLAAGPAWHAVLLGFVFSAVFGDAPALLSTLTGVEPRPSPWLRGPVWLLAASLVVRIVAAGFSHPGALAVAGVGHAVAIVWFAVGLLLALRHTQRR